MPVRKPKAEITVLPGVNGAGKSSIGGAHLRAGDSEYFNPDEVAGMLRAGIPDSSAKRPTPLPGKKVKCFWSRRLPKAAISLSRPPWEGKPSLTS